MISREEIRDYRVRNNLSLRDVASYCDVSYSLIGMIETGEKELTDFNYKEIIRGINGASFAKKNGTFRQVDKSVPKDTPNTSKEKEVKKNIKRETPNVDILNEDKK